MTHLDRLFFDEQDLQLAATVAGDRDVHECSSGRCHAFVRSLRRERLSFIGATTVTTPSDPWDSAPPTLENMHRDQVV